jgi:predicted DNA binding CopG/RHH family protein
MKKPLKIPKFKNEDQEREFWSKIDLGDYVEPKDLKRVVFPNLKPTTRSISLRIPTYIIAEAKQKANAMNIPYQSLLKQYIAEGVMRKK